MTEPWEAQRDELLDALIDATWQGCDHNRKDAELIGHRFMSSYEHAFEVLEKYGRLEYVQADPRKQYWARIVPKEDKV